MGGNPKHIGIREQLQSLTYNNIEPFYIPDTSGVIDFGKQDLAGLVTFLSRRNGDTLIVPGVLEEIERSHGTAANRRRYVTDDVLQHVSRLAQANSHLLEEITCHPQYAAHRRQAETAAAKACSRKKKVHDPISDTDLDILACALTVAATPVAFTGIARKNYPVILTSDSHIYCTATLLSSPDHPCHKPQHRQYETMKIIYPQ